MSKRIICEKCFSELNITSGFCPYCGAQVIARSGIDIYNKGDKFYLRYRKGNHRVQTPLAPNYNNLPYDSKKLIYAEARKILDSKLAANRLAAKSRTSKIDTFGDLVDSYVYHIYCSKVQSIGKRKIKLGTFEKSYVMRQTILKRFPIYQMPIKNINYDSMCEHINDFVKQRMSGVATGYAVSPNTIGQDIYFLRCVLLYAYEEETINLPYRTIQKIIKYARNVEPYTRNDYADTLSSSNRIALSSAQFNLFLKEFFRETPKLTTEEIFYPIVGNYTANIFTSKALLFCQKHYNRQNATISDVLFLFRKNLQYLFNRDILNHGIYPECRSFFKLMKSEYKKSSQEESWADYYHKTVENTIVDALELFPLCYKEFVNKIENTMFDGAYYPVIRSYSQNGKCVEKSEFKSELPDSAILYKSAPKRDIPNIYYGNSLAVPILLLMSQTGLRANEAASLKVGDILTYELSDGTTIRAIQVHQQLLKLMLTDEKGIPLVNECGCVIHQYEESSTKTKSSTRLVPLTPLAELAIEVAMHDNNITYDDTDKYVFDAAIIEGQNYKIRRWMTILLENIRCYNLSGSHTLRRTVASQLAQHGYETSFIKQILGHAKGSVTEGYITIDLEHKYFALCESVMPDWFPDVPKPDWLKHN